MVTRFRLFALLCALVAMSGCAGGPLSGVLGSDADAPGRPGAAVQAPETDTPRPAPRASETESEAPEPGAELGRTIATLGSPGEPGLWLRTPLVDAARPGVIRLADGTASAEVELRPSGGAPGSGSALSMAAFRLLGIPLTDLPELLVIAR